MADQQQQSNSTSSSGNPSQSQSVTQGEQGQSPIQHVPFDSLPISPLTGLPYDPELITYLEKGSGEPTIAVIQKPELKRKQSE
jgi:hypothetical protein